MSVQFSGGEPTMSPYFFDAVAYARKIGYNQRAGGDERQSSSRRRQGVLQEGVLKRGCGMRTCSFDGIGNDANSHRQIGNLFGREAARH